MSVFAIDVDGDGDVDVLSASATDDTVAWYENDGSQSFTERMVTNMADGAMSVFAIDVDGDGDVDVLSAFYYDDTVAWYENGSSQSFTEHVLTNSANGAWFVSAADADGDGDVDVLSAAYLGNTVAWHENGGGAFAQIDGHCDGYASFERICPSSDATCGGWSDFIVGQGGAGDSLVACQTRCAEASCGGIYFDDAHGCGNYDACADSGDGQNWGASFYIRVSNAFTERVIATHAVYAVSVFAIDVDGDGDVDALFHQFRGDVVRERRRPSFTERLISSVGADAADSVYAIDVDGDGDADALSASKTDDTVAWYENDGTQSFTERIITTLADGAMSVFPVDVDGDGDVDPLSTSRYDDTVAWYENGDAQSFTERIISTTADFATSVFAIDVDGDGDVDVLSASGSDNTVAWYENDGAQSFTKRIISASAGGAYAVFAIDLDGDGDSFTERVFGTPDRPASYAIDVDGDGDVDALGVRRRRHGRVVRGRLRRRAYGGAVCRDGRAYGGAVCEYHADDEPRADERCPNAAADDFLHERLILQHTISNSATGAFGVYAFDADGDGVDDVLSASYSDDTVAWFENDGSQSFTERILTTLAEGARNLDNTIAWYENDGSQSFTARVVTNAADGAYPSSRSTWTATATHALGVRLTARWRGTRTTGPSPSQSWLLRTRRTKPTLSSFDVDGDGDIDALSSSYGDDTVSWYENDGSQSFTTRIITTLADGAHSVAAADVDGDGDADALSAAYGAGAIAWHENECATRDGDADAAASPAPTTAAPVAADAPSAAPRRRLRRRRGRVLRGRRRG
ncbi:6-phosphogluconolactonase [Aureococcus anophagefferens]|nr:6-phosphogluconolactonase [Aureococcus anophagefferens]